MKKPTFRERFAYWFDAKMSASSLGLIKFLAAASLCIVFVVSLLIVVFGFDDGSGFPAVFWNSLATIINAWMPYSEDGGPGYLILTAAAALIGLLFTSVLIGIIAAAVEERVNSLRRGTSRVLEEGHIVILGFYPGEYTLIRQLVLASGDAPSCIVVADDVEQEEMQESIYENIDVPRNVRIICRTVDVFDAVSLERCSVSSCKTVVVSPTDDYRTAKILLAVASNLEKSANQTARVCAMVSCGDHSFPPTFAERFNITMLQSGETIARIIAHSCTQPGLSDTFWEMFKFEGDELYASCIPGASGNSFEDILLGTDGGVPVGILRGGKTFLNPPSDMTVQQSDRILFFAESPEDIRFKRSRAETLLRQTDGGLCRESVGTISILGGNETITTVLRELPDHLSKVILAGGAMNYKDETMQISDERGDFAVSFFNEDISRKSALTELAGRSAHIIILSDHDKADDDADMESILLIMNLRDIRARHSLSFNITAEMRREYNQRLAVADDDTDFIVASNMSSLLLAQLAESPELIHTFTELLSNTGNELYLKRAGQLGCTGRQTGRSLRRTALSHRYIMIGYRKDKRSFFNPALSDAIELQEDDALIVIGEA